MNTLIRHAVAAHPPVSVQSFHRKGESGGELTTPVVSTAGWGQGNALALALTLTLAIAIAIAHQLMK